MKERLILLVCAAFQCFGFFGCGPRLHHVQVVPDPAGAEVSYDGQVVGVGAVEVSVPVHDTSGHRLRACGPAGYFCTEHVVLPDTPTPLHLAVPRDNAWWATAEDARVNRWLAVRVAPEALGPRWDALAEAIAQECVDFEVRDRSAYYLRTRWMIIGEKEDEARIRTQVTVEIDGAGTDALRFRLLIDSERIDREGVPRAKAVRAAPALLDLANRFGFEVETS